MTWRAGLLLLALAMVLTGCRVDIAAEIAVREDGSGTVGVTLTADREILADAPTIAGDLALDDATVAGWTVDGPSATPDGGLRVSVTKPFRSLAEAQVILDELAGDQGPLGSLVLAQDRSFATLRTTLTGTAGLPGGLAAFGDGDLVAALGGSQPFAAAVGDRPLAEVLGVTLAVSFPGEVTSAGPAATVAPDGSSATYVVPVDGTTVDLATTAELRDPDALAARRRERLAVGGLVLWLALLAGGAAWWWLRGRPAPPRSRGDGPDGPHGPHGPDGPDGPDGGGGPEDRVGSDEAGRPRTRPPALPVRAPRAPASGPPTEPGGRPIDPGLTPPRPIDPGLTPPRPIDPGSSLVRRGGAGR